MHLILNFLLTNRRVAFDPSMWIVIEALRLKHRRIIFHQTLLKDLLVPLIQVVGILNLLTVDSNGRVQIDLGHISIGQTWIIN